VIEIESAKAVFRSLGLYVDPPAHAPRQVAPHTVATSPDHAAQVRLEVRAMTSCPWRGRKVECGCNGARLCHLTRGEAGRVTALDCQRCEVARAELLGSMGRQLTAPRTQISP